MSCPAASNSITNNLPPSTHPVSFSMLVNRNSEAQLSSLLSKTQPTALYLRLPPPPQSKQNKCDTEDDVLLCSRFSEAAAAAAAAALHQYHAQHFECLFKTSSLDSRSLQGEPKYNPECSDSNKCQLPLYAQV